MKGKSVKIHLFFTFFDPRRLCRAIGTRALGTTWGGKMMSTRIALQFVIGYLQGGNDGFLILA